LALQRNTEFEAKESIRLPKSDSSRRSLYHSLSRFRITSVVAYSRISNAQHYTQTANPQMTHKHLTECGSVRIDQQRQSGAKRNADAPIPPGACGVMRTFWLLLLRRLPLVSRLISASAFFHIRFLTTVIHAVTE